MRASEWPALAKRREQVWPKIVALFLAALLLGIGAALWANNTTKLWWHLGTLASTAMLLALAYILPRGLRLVGQVLVLVWGLGLCGMVFYQSYRVLEQFNPWHHVNPFFVNANFLGAALATVGVVTLVLCQSRWIGLSALGLLSALVLTGSRTALVAYLVALVSWFLLLGGWRSKVPIFLVLIGLAGSSYVGLRVWLGAQPSPSGKNLLIYSDTLEHPAWTKRYAVELTLEPVSLPGPMPGGKVYHVRGRSNPEAQYPTKVVIQNAALSEEDIEYVASVHLRTDSPQRMRLGSNMTGTICEVTLEWQRCQAPVSHGNGRTSIGLHLDTVQPGELLDIYVWGAQVEVGEVPTAPEHTSKNPFAEFLKGNALKDLMPQGWQDDRNLVSRAATYRSAWRIFLAHPVAGVGLGNFYREAQALGREGPGAGDTHAHNLPLQMLAETGILGFLSWAVPFFGVLALFWRRHWRRLLPLAVCVLVLNMTDFTYYHSGVYYLYWLTVGLIVFGKTGGAGRQIAAANES